MRKHETDKGVSKVESPTGEAPAPHKPFLRGTREKKTVIEFPEPKTVRPSQRDEPLKTLKDIKCLLYKSTRWTPTVLLRAEAIRWVKKHKKDSLSWKQKGVEANAEWCEFIVCFIKDFFNLTEADLK